MHKKITELIEKYKKYIEARENVLHCLFSEDTTLIVKKEIALFELVIKDLQNLL